MRKHVDVIEQVIRGIVKSAGFRELMAGINNALAHGKIFDEANIHCDDEILEKIFGHIDALIAIAKKMH